MMGPCEAKLIRKYMRATTRATRNMHHWIAVARAEEANLKIQEGGNLIRQPVD